MGTARRSLLLAAALALAGLVLAVVLARQHAQAHAGFTSFCTLNDVVNCDRVATSRYSVVLGLPLAVWGAFAYGLALLLSVAGLSRSRPHETWPAGLLFVLSAAATLAAVVLALVSEIVIGALCLLCAASWLVSAALLAAAWRATRPAGVRGAVRADLGLLRARAARTAGLALAGAAVVALVAAAYPRYWERKPPPVAARQVPTTSASPPAGRPVLVEFSDYECPFCALAHDELKQILANRPDVQLVKKHFPLDPSCNPAVKRPMHPNACALAAAAICAEEQGKLEPMDDALFRNQKERRPIDDVAARVGLDAARFRECLRAPGTIRRLRSDIAAALSVGIQATPTYVVNGRPHTGRLTAEMLPPPAPSPAPGPRAP